MRERHIIIRVCNDCAFIVGQHVCVYHKYITRVGVLVRTKTHLHSREASIICSASRSTIANRSMCPRQEWVYTIYLCEFNCGMRGYIYSLPAATVCAWMTRYIYIRVLIDARSWTIGRLIAFGQEAQVFNEDAIVMYWAKYYCIDRTSNVIDTALSVGLYSSSIAIAVADGQSPTGIVSFSDC